MKNFCTAVCIAFALLINPAFGASQGMPQLNPEFWAAQIFWLILIFSILYLIIWKIFLPKITYSIENRKSKMINDLQEAQKVKENAEKKLNEYNKIIEDTKKQAKTIIQDNKKKLENEIKNKKQKFDEEIEKELLKVEDEIKALKKSSIPNINKIAEEISSEIIKLLVNSNVNTSNVSAIVADVSKKKVEKYI